LSPAIRLRDVSFSYGGPPVLEHVDLEIAADEFTALVGPNGGGKSTLLRIVLGLLNPSAGTVEVFGRPPLEARHLIGYCPQFVSFSRSFPITAGEVVMLGRLGPAAAPGRFGARDLEAARAAMRSTDTEGLQERRLGTLSGGELQRVLIARALASRPRLLVLDESTANVDHRAGAEIFELLARLSEHMTILVVSHDIGFVSSYVGRVACLNRQLEIHPTAEIDSEVLNRMYGAGMSMIDHRH
jgi:zinc transport system ATP-binding protein